jgi:hypothetical protein
MSEPVATRVDDGTKQWLENKADEEDITVSALVSDIVERHSGDGNDSEPDSTEIRLSKIEQTLQERTAELEMQINKLRRHAVKLEKEQIGLANNATGVMLPDDATYPPLPGDDERRKIPNSPTVQF